MDQPEELLGVGHIGEAELAIFGRQFQLSDFIGQLAAFLGQLRLQVIPVLAGALVPGEGRDHIDDGEIPLLLITVPQGADLLLLEDLDGVLVSHFNGKVGWLELDRSLVIDRAFPVVRDFRTTGWSHFGGAYPTTPCTPQSLSDNGLQCPPRLPEVLHRRPGDLQLAALLVHPLAFGHFLHCAQPGQEGATPQGCVLAVRQINRTSIRCAILLKPLSRVSKGMFKFLAVAAITASGSLSL